MEMLKRRRKPTCVTGWWSTLIQKNHAKHAQQRLNLPAFQPKRESSGKLHPRTAAAGILVLSVRDNCAKYAAFRETSHPSCSQCKGTYIRSRAVSMAERLCCDLNSSWENTPDNRGAEPVRNAPPPLRLPSKRRRNGEQPSPVATLQVSNSEHLCCRHKHEQKQNQS